MKHIVPSTRPNPLPDLKTIQLALYVFQNLLSREALFPASEQVAQRLLNGDTTVSTWSDEEVHALALQAIGDDELASIMVMIRRQNLLPSHSQHWHDSFWRFYNAALSAMQSCGSNWNSILNDHALRLEILSAFTTPEEIIDDMVSAFTLQYRGAVTIKLFQDHRRLVHYMNTIQVWTPKGEVPKTTSPKPPTEDTLTDEEVRSGLGEADYAKVWEQMGDIIGQLINLTQSLVLEIWGQEGFERVKDLINADYFATKAKQPPTPST